MPSSPTGLHHDAAAPTLAGNTGHRPATVLPSTDPAIGTDPTRRRLRRGSTVDIRSPTLSIFVERSCISISRETFESRGHTTPGHQGGGNCARTYEVSAFVAVLGSPTSTTYIFTAKCIPSSIARLSVPNSPGHKMNCLCRWCPPNSS
jgi:hypothetical protein